MHSRLFWPLSVVTCLAAAGCTLIHFDQLVPEATVSEVGTLPVSVTVCSPAGGSSPTALAQRQGLQLAALQSNVQRVEAAIPQLIAQPVVNAALAHVQYVSANALVTARRLLSNGQTNAQDEEYLASVPKPAAISPSDIMTFGHTVAASVLRNTGSSPDSTNALAQQFWADVKGYYTAYYKGTFVNYFSQSITQPKAQLTIDDTEISQAAGVFLEVLFDELLTPTVWTDGSKYYPGGGSKPTYLTVFNAQAVKLAKPDGACGMTEGKANTLNYLANTFSTAASGEVSLTVKTFGGLEVPLGIFGKLNVGDNNTLTTLVQLVVSESVKRLTVAIAAPILEAIQINTSAAPTLASRQALGSSSSTGRQGQLIQMYSTPFVSGGESSL